MTRREPHFEDHGMDGDDLAAAEKHVADAIEAAVDVPASLPPRELIFPNGLGGFTRDGHEYVITLEHGQMTPAPWVNVLANPDFGTVVSAHVFCPV